MKYAAYENYKSTASDWLGNVPSHWQVDRLKWSTTGSYNGVWGDEPNEIDDLICVRVADFDRERFVVVDNPPTMRAIEPSQRRNRLLQKNDLLIEKSGGGEKQLVGCVVQFTADVPAVSSNFVARLPVASGCDSRFLTYAHAAIYAGKLNYPSIKQTTGIQNLDSGEYLNILAPYPPFEEQQTIARFLDAKTAQIDDLIAKKRQLIDKLKEKRSALIARTVTRGLPPEAAKAAGLEPHPEMKDSGVEWLGNVPYHWKVKSIKWESPVQRGASPRPIDDPNYFDDDGEYAWVRISDVTSAGMYLDTTEQRLSDLGSSLSVKMQPGSLFLSIAGTVGKPCIANIKCCIHDGFVYFPRWKGEPRFLFYLFASGEPYKGLGKMGTQLNLNTDTVGSIVIGIPDSDEQKLIADYLDKTTIELDLATTAVAAVINRLVEYRQALITSAVTGKIDVRETPTLPEAA